MDKILVTKSTMDGYVLTMSNDLRGFDGSSWKWWLAIWLGYTKFLEGGGRHFLQKEWRQGRSFGSLLWKFNLQIGQQSIKLWVLCAFSLSSWTGMLSASFSTIITMSSASTFSAASSMIDSKWRGVAMSQVDEAVGRRGIGSDFVGCKWSLHEATISWPSLWFSQWGETNQPNV